MPVQNIQSPSGGSAILVRSDIIQSYIPIDTNLQAVTLRITLHKAITFCSIYIPPDTSIAQYDLDKLSDLLPPPYLLMGNFNSHSPFMERQPYQTKLGKNQGVHF